MVLGAEQLDSAQPATKAESTALLVEVINIALYGDEDPWNSDMLFGDDSGVEMSSLDKGHQAAAAPKDSGPNILCKYDPCAKDSLLLGSERKVHLASLAIAGKTYDFFAATQEDHTENDTLSDIFHLLEENEGEEEIGIARALDLETLPEDFTIEVFEDLPTRGTYLRSIGNLGLQFAELLDSEDKTGLVANSEGMKAEAGLADSALAMEVDLAATTVDGQLVRTLIVALREGYNPIVRY